MSAVFEDSDRRCARCHKKMLVEIGQKEDVGGTSVGLAEMVHTCFSCGYRERDDQWRRPKRRRRCRRGTLTHQA